MNLPRPLGRMLLLSFGSFLLFFVGTSIASLIPIFGAIMMASICGELYARTANANARASRSGMVLGILAGAISGTYVMSHDFMFSGGVALVTIPIMIWSNWRMRRRIVDGSATNAPLSFRPIK